MANGKLFINGEFAGDVEDFQITKVFTPEMKQDVLGAFAFPEPSSNLWLPGDDVPSDLPAGFAHGFAPTPSGLWLPNHLVPCHPFAGNTFTASASLPKMSPEGIQKAIDSLPPMTPLYGVSIMTPLKLTPSFFDYQDSLKSAIFGSFGVPKSVITGPSQYLSPYFNTPVTPCSVVEPIRRHQLAHDDSHLFSKPDTKDRGEQFDEQEILRSAIKNRFQYAWSEWLQAHVRIG